MVRPPESLDKSHGGSGLGMTAAGLRRADPGPGRAAGTLRGVRIWNSRTESAQAGLDAARVIAVAIQGRE